MTLVNAETGEVVAKMSPDEARDLTRRMVEHRDELWRLAVESHDRRAWAALGYDSWRDYIKAEVGVESSRAYQLLDHGRTMLALSPGGEPDSTMVESLPTSERQTRPLARLASADEKREAWSEAQAAAESEGRPTTARDVEQAVTKRTERESRSVTTESPEGETSSGRDSAQCPAAPSSDEADSINRGYENHADGGLVYRKHVTGTLNAALKVKQLDAERAAQSVNPDSREAVRGDVQGLADWCQRFIDAMKPDLRRVQ